MHGCVSWYGVFVADRKEIMANYFVYLSSGMPPTTSAATPTTRWVDIYEDGQGRGQMTAACSTVYNFGTTSQPMTPPQLFGVVCLGIAWPLWQSLTDAQSVWSGIQVPTIPAAAPVAPLVYSASQHLCQTKTPITATARTSSMGTRTDVTDCRQPVAPPPPPLLPRLLSSSAPTSR